MDDEKRMNMMFPVIKDPSAVTCNKNQVIKMATQLEERRMRNGIITN